MTVKMSAREHDVLVILGDLTDEDFCTYFRVLVSFSNGLDKTQVKRSVRSLTRKGLAEYQRGLMDDDGTVAGSGYRISRAGRALLAAQ